MTYRLCVVADGVTHSHDYPDLDTARKDAYDHLSRAWDVAYRGKGRAGRLAADGDFLDLDTTVHIGATRGSCKCAHFSYHIDEVAA